MDLVYKRATIHEIDILVKTRIEVLRAANKLEESINMSIVEQQSYDYYKDTLEEDKHVAYLVFDKDKFVGTGAISFFRVMPTYHNPTGEKAYIMNMYTRPEYRRNGIAYKLLDLLVGISKEKNILHISLEATDMGRPLYQKYGFLKMNDEMMLSE